ncbi:MAG: hypothetical protein JRH11_06690 [Deltaproteobacteria bacterium]|nr:hypothetical protein [Deltaproteobacteria bacterium]
MAGTTAYVANHNQGLIVVDVSTPSAPAVVTNLPLTGESQDLHIDGSLVYLASNVRLNVVDVASPGSPTLVDSMSAGTRAYEVWGAGGAVYSADLFTGQVFLFTATAAALTPTGMTERVGFRGYRAIDGEGGRLAVGTDGGSSGTVQLYDRSGGGAPVLIDEAPVAAPVYGVRLVGDVIYAVNEFGFLTTFSTTLCGP